MSYAVIFAVELGTLPEGPRRGAERAFGQIAEAVAALPASSPFFTSAQRSVLQVDVEEWRLAYRLDPLRRELRVIEAAARPRG